MRRLAVLGHPVAHSRSPAMQNAALEALGLSGEWSYETIEVEPDRFAERVLAMPGEGFVGANLTVPHKGAAMAMATELSAAAREIGAANTLSFDGDEIRADNTDAEGFLVSLPSSPRGMRALVVGAGGAGRAIVWALIGEGAEVEIWNRTELRSENLAAEIGGTAVDRPSAADYTLIVNSTAVGLGGEDPFAELPLSPGDFREGQIVVDLVYGAEPTPLLRAAAEAGAMTVDGIEILVNQGAASLRLWTGAEPPLEVMRRGARGGPLPAD